MNWIEFICARNILLKKKISTNTCRKIFMDPLIDGTNCNQKYGMLHVHFLLNTISKIIKKKRAERLFIFSSKKKNSFYFHEQQTAIFINRIFSSNWVNLAHVFLLELLISFNSWAKNMRKRNGMKSRMHVYKCVLLELPFTHVVIWRRKKKEWKILCAWVFFFSYQYVTRFIAMWWSILHANTFHVISVSAQSTLKKPFLNVFFLDHA